jgi:HPr kinase/phosphorylase
MECRGIGIINIAEMFGIKSIRLEKRIDLVVSLHEWTPDVVEERTGLEENYYEILGIKVPHIEFYVRPAATSPASSRSPPSPRRSKSMGHDPAKDFNDRLIAHMAEQQNAPQDHHRLSKVHSAFPRRRRSPERGGRVGLTN